MLNNLIINDDHVKSKLKQLYQDDKYYYFYKHLGIDEKELVFNLFKNCQFKYSYPKNFNDPYDCHFETEINFENFDREIFNQAFGQKINSKMWKLLENQLKLTLKKQMLEGVMDEFRESYSVTCFNNAPLNILMWSHYAKNHEGFMVEFKFSKSHINSLPAPVIYTKNYPIISLPWNVGEFLSNTGNQYETLKKIFLHKSIDWAYEDEYRLLAEKKEFIDFPPQMISSVILGTKITKESESKMKDVLSEFNRKNHTNIKIYKSNLIHKKYELEIPTHPRLSKQGV